MRLVVTGGAGFIGSALVREAIVRGHHVLNIDALTYAADLRSCAEAASHPHYQFHQVDISDGGSIAGLLQAFEPQAIVHLAAESHVDRSIAEPDAFIRTNVVGTYTLLKLARDYWSQLAAPSKATFRFIHVSTDEVYGSLGDGDPFVETSPYAPNSPYSASKAAGDHLARAWFKTYDLPVIITNCSNNYGPYQHPEKLIPTIIRNAVAGRPIPIYGDGKNRRDWIFVNDHVAGLLTSIERGRPGETYLFGGRCELSNLELAGMVCELLDARESHPSYRRRANQITFVKDRPGHDFRYAANPAKAEAELGWRAATAFRDGLAATVDWYLANREWLARGTQQLVPAKESGHP
jgi:dTDP-glucose 4,6-dehydratase